MSNIISQYSLARVKVMLHHLIIISYSNRKGIRGEGEITEDKACFNSGIKIKQGSGCGSVLSILPQISTLLLQSHRRLLAQSIIHSFHY